jgi:hypothetical protein
LVPGLAPAGVQLRVHSQERRHVTWHVDLGDEVHEAVLGVGDERAEVTGAVGRFVAGRAAGGQASALVVGQVHVQDVELVEREQVDHSPDLVRGQVRTG